MKLAIARPGYFTEKRFEPSMQTNWMNYDLLTVALKKYGIDVTTIGFSDRFGADRVISITGLGDVVHDPKHYRTKTQQSVTSSIMLEENDDLLDGVDFLLMPYYTFFEERCHYYTLAYLAAERDIPLFIWDTDANFIGQAGVANYHYTIRQARDRVFKDPVYVNPDIIDISVIDDLQLHVLSPALDAPVYITYFPFFHIFGRRLSWGEYAKAHDVVYAGSQYQREDAFLRYYNTHKYEISVVGKYKKEFMEKWGLSKTAYAGHLGRKHVQRFLASGKVCVHIARDFYCKIGHVTPRVYEVVDSGTLLLVDGSLKYANRIVGDRYVVNSVEDVLYWVNRPDGALEREWKIQSESPFIIDATVDVNARLLYEAMK